MELFYAEEVAGGICRLSGDEASHCVRVLRHRVGDGIFVIDGSGTMTECRILSATSSSVEASIVLAHPHWHAHPYHLTMAVAPTKNNDRFEWFAEKAVELGVDRIVPVIGEHSERRVYKSERLRKIALSASKQSLKADLPVVEEPVPVLEFIAGQGMNHDAVASELSDNQGVDVRPLKLIAYCFEGENRRTSIQQAISDYLKEVAQNEAAPGSAFGLMKPEITVLIGPEGDFSKKEVEEAMAAGFMPVHLGTSRLRTETAALTAVEAVYFAFMDETRYTAE